MNGIITSTSLRLAMVALLLLPTEAFVAPILPPRTSSASSTQRFSSIAMDPPPRSIGERVQELMEKNRENKLARRSSASQAPSDTSSTSTDASALSVGRHNLPNVYHAASKEECMEIAENRLSRLTVFKFFSSYCRACKRIEPRFDRLAKENPDVDFVFVPVSATNKKFIVEELGIPALPYGGIYHPEVGMAETMSFSSQRLGDFEAIVESYREAECQLPEVDEEEAEDALFAAPYQRISSATK